MIPRPKSAPRHHGTLPGTASTGPVAAVPTWLRRSAADAQRLAAQGLGPNALGLNALGPNALEDVSLAAGAAIGALDAVVRRHERWAGAWRQRLAFSAAAVTARQAGRVEDEAALRDAVLLTRPGDDVGPAGRILAGRRLTGIPADKLLTDASIGAVLDDLGLARDDERVGDLADDLRQLGTSDGTMGMVTGAIASAERLGYGAALGKWLADALLAQRVGHT